MVREDIFGILPSYPIAGAAFMKLGPSLPQRPPLGLAPTLEASHTPDCSRTPLAMPLSHLAVGYLRSLL